MVSKRIALAALFLSLCTAVSCGGESPAELPSSSEDLQTASLESESAETEAGTGTETESEPETQAGPESPVIVNKYPEPDIPEWNAGGRPFVFLSEKLENDWDIDFIDSEAMNGETINDAVFRRNLQMEERFNIRIERKDSGFVGQEASNLSFAGDPSVDIAFGFATGLGDFIPLGSFIALNETA